MVPVARLPRSSRCLLTRVAFSLKGVVEAFAFKGVDVLKNSLLVAGSFVCHLTLIVVVPVSTATAVITGGVVSGGADLVVNENSEEVAVLPARSVALMSA